MFFSLSLCLSIYLTGSFLNAVLVLHSISDIKGIFLPLLLFLDSLMILHNVYYVMIYLHSDIIPFSVFIFLSLSFSLSLSLLSSFLPLLSHFLFSSCLLTTSPLPFSLFLSYLPHSTLPTAPLVSFSLLPFSISHIKGIFSVYTRRGDPD